MRGTVGIGGHCVGWEEPAEWVVTECQGRWGLARMRGGIGWRVGGSEVGGGEVVWVVAG